MRDFGTANFELDGFLEAREELLEFKSASFAPEYLREALSVASLNRLLRKNDKATFSLEIQRRVIYFTGKFSPFVYHSMGAWISQTTAELDTLKRFVGNYKYGREIPVGSELSYDVGLIRIFEKRGIILFEHSSPNVEPHGTTEHTGFVYLSKDMLYFLGFRETAFRLAIARIPNNDPRTFNMRKHLMWGTFNSISASEAFPIAARFVMIHEDNREYIEAFDSKRGGASAFRKAARGRYQFANGDGPADP